MLSDAQNQDEDLLESHDRSDCFSIGETIISIIILDKGKTHYSIPFCLKMREKNDGFEFFIAKENLLTAIDTLQTFYNSKLHPVTFRNIKNTPYSFRNSQYLY
jgi:hypothetical protein